MHAVSHIRDCALACYAVGGCFQEATLHGLEVEVADPSASHRWAMHAVSQIRDCALARYAVSGSIQEASLHGWRWKVADPSASHRGAMHTLSHIRLCALARYAVGGCIQEASLHGWRWSVAVPSASHRWAMHTLPEFVYAHVAHFRRRSADCKLAAFWSRGTQSTAGTGENHSAVVAYGPIRDMNMHHLE